MILPILVFWGLLFYLNLKSKNFQGDFQPEFFVEEEFRGYANQLNPVLLQKLDEFAHNWGGSVIVSPAAGAIIRDDPTSQHHRFLGNAIDVMLPDMVTKADANRAINVAKNVGFTGIGIYPDWLPYAGMHLDVREGSRATWGGVDVDGSQEYIAINKAVTYFS